MDARTLETDPQQGSLLPVQDLFRVLLTKNRETFHHSERVERLAREWGAYMRSRHRWADVSVEELVWCARCHDLGKIGIQNRILDKVGPLDALEKEIMKQHSELGFELFSSSSGNSAVAEGILFHHERWDGQGYPAGLSGESIPILARMVAIVDAFDAMTSARSYQKARTPREALQEIRLNAGRQFCPSLVEDFTQFLNAQNS